MSTSDDTFANFVGSLSGCLDDHEMTTVDLATRLFVSRSHFDRIVSATSGETPARFRRRILLERAAYRLATTRDGVLDVAIEAGYSSNEAFTRAFQRAYGSSPAHWRAEPTTVHLSCPNNVHFHPPGALRIPARTKVTSMDLLLSMIDHHVWLVGQMIDKAAELGDDQIDEPIELSVDDDRQTIRSLLSRLVGQMDMWNCAISMRAYDWSLEDHEPLEAMRSRLADVGSRFAAQTREVVESGRVDDTFLDALCEPPEVFTYGGMIAHVLTFAAHRRTLVALALKSRGIEDLGWGDPMRWVAGSVAG